MGRNRGNIFIFRPKLGANRNIGIIGCGQYAFATIGYFICKSQGNIIVDCFDPCDRAKQTFSDFYQIDEPSSNAQSVLANSKTEVIYIASNHASHAEYAVEALRLGKIVFVEKPLATDIAQLSELHNAVTSYKGEIYAGYNRPFSSALVTLRNVVRTPNMPISLGCFVIGHKLEKDHWYRDDKEGTRICGNLSHWLDLAVHILSWGDIPDNWTVTVAYSNNDSPDDDLAISLVSKRGDLVNVVMTSREEPFEGINETINFQQGKVIAKIDDFRAMQIWNGSKKSSYKYWPKDVGHSRSLLQPYIKTKRVWREVEASSVLTLFIMNMVLQHEVLSEFSFSRELSALSKRLD